MNKIYSGLSLLLMLCGTAEAAGRIETQNSWTETFAVTGPAPTLELSNIWGNVVVRPGPDGEISVKIDERRSAPDQARFERSLESLKLRISAEENSVSMYVGGPERNWQHANRCRGCKVEYQFEVRVPSRTRLDVSTVNDGYVDVEGISGTVSAGNVNGPVTLSNFAECESLNTVNGDIELSFMAAPARDCEIETVNGDVVLSLPEGSGLDLAMDLFNGSVRTDIPVEPLAMPAKVEHSESKGRHQYRIEQAAGIRIAGGGPIFTISSLNGDIRIQKSK